MRKLGIPDYSRISAVGNLVTVEMEWRKFSAATVSDLRSQVTIGFLRFLPEITLRASHPHILFGHFTCRRAMVLPRHSASTSASDPLRHARVVIICSLATTSKPAPTEHVSFVEMLRIACGATVADAPRGSTMMERPDERGDDESLPSERGKSRGAGSRPQSEFARVAHVLVVDDDPAMRAMIADYLTDQNMRVSVATNSREMQRVVAADGVDLVVLDLKLGNEDGLAIVRALRAESNLPIIVLTGHRREAVDRVVGLELGADDYLTKPFNPRELLARVHAVLRRSPAARPDGEAKRTRYRFAGWELSLRTRRLVSPAGEHVPLTKGEFGLLAVFLEAPQRVLTREHLLAASRVHDNEVFDRSIDVQILRLRRKLEVDPSAPALIKTERGVGYVFSSPVDVR